MAGMVPHKARRYAQKGHGQGGTKDRERPRPRQDTTVERFPLGSVQHACERWLRMLVMRACHAFCLLWCKLQSRKDDRISVPGIPS